MPTPKQTKHHYKKCRRYFHLLLRALTDAHNADVINYRRRDMDIKDQDLDGVCDTVRDARRFFEAATEEARADAFKNECMKELKGVW